MQEFGDDFLNVEAKRGSSVPDNLPTTICAFANMPTGGTVLLGVDEGTNFSVTGVNEPAKIIKAVTTQTRSSIDPAPQIFSDVVPIDGKIVVAITVNPLSPEHKPARYRGKAYLRQSDGDYEMNANDLQLIRNASLIAARSHETDSEPVPGTTRADLNSELTSRYIAEVRQYSRRLSQVVNDADLLRTLKVILPDGTLSVSGLYGLGFFPQAAEPALRVTAAVRMPEGFGGPRNRNIETFEGAVPDLLEDAVAWVARNADTIDEYQASGHMKKRSEFPLRAIRETIANALVHRDLSAASLGGGKSVEIRLTRERLIITNPGGLHGLSIEQLTSSDLAKSAVNQRLYNLMRHVKTSDGSSVIEGEGGGIAEILRACRDSNLTRPQFFDNGAQFKVIFRRQPRLSAEQRQHAQKLAHNQELSLIQMELLLSLEQGATWSIGQMRKQFAPLGQSEADDLLTELSSLKLASYQDGVLRPRDTSHETPRDKGTQQRRTSDFSSVHGTNTAAIIAQLNQAPMRFPELVEAIPELSPGQLRYALKQLQTAGSVLMEGRQGQRSTRYRINRSPKE